ncbi:MAG: tetratricopeptide repeat protein [Candidatus Hodarchaeales archaeon]
MATREEKSIRLELPSTSGVECEIRQDYSRDEFIVTFFQNDRQLKSCSLSSTHLNQDKMVDLLSDAGVEFFSFSAIFDVADLLINKMNEMVEPLTVEEERFPAETSQIVEEEIIEETTEKNVVTSVDSHAEREVQPTVPHVEIKPGDKILDRFEMPYSQNGSAAIYFTLDGKFAVVLFKENNPIARKVFTKESVNQDDIVAMISESGIDFLSFSAIYDSAERIEQIIKNPEALSKEKGSESTTEAEEIQRGPDAETQVTIEESIDADVGIIDLSALDASEYTKAEDFDRFLEKVKEFVSQGQPLPVKEMKIEQSGGAVCIILRKMDSWFLQFRLSEGTVTNLTEINLDQDEIARAINKDIPQISFSYLYDASEKVLKTIEVLSKTPIDEIILNVAVGHYLKVIEGYEEEGDLKSASKVTQVLFKRFQKERNAKGVLQFGKKLVAYLEKQKKASKAAKLRDEITEQLLELDPQNALEFVEESIETMIEQGSHLSAANLVGIVLDYFLTEETQIADLTRLVALAKKQVDLYEKARLPVVMWENALRYAHFLIRQISGLGEKKITLEEREAYNEDIILLLDKALNAQDEKKAYFELIESLESTLELFKELNFKSLYSKYADRLIVTAETQNKKEKALKISKECSSFLMDVENYVKACDYGNQSIKLYYELNKIDEAVDFSLEIVKGLVEIKETNAARDYLKFVENLIDQAYASNESRRIEKQLALGDLFGKLGMKDRSKTYIETALQTIKDPKRREKIVLKYVDDLLENQAVFTAQEMINLELTRLLSEKKMEDVLKFCKNFISKLKDYNQIDMAFEYMKYSANLMLQTDKPNYNLLLDYVKDLLRVQDFDKAAFMMDQLLALQIKQQDFTRAIDSMGRFITHLFENTDRFDLMFNFIHRTAEVFYNMGDPDGALESLISFQKEALKCSADLAQKITDMILNQLEAKEEYKKCISVVSNLIDKQFESGNYEDAYLFSVQNARYYERLGDIAQVIKYLEKVRDIFFEHKQYEDANRMTDLIIRFGKSNNEYKYAINAVKNYIKTALERNDTITAANFAIEISKLFDEEGKLDKALEFLQMVFNSIYESDKESAILVFEQILKMRAKEVEFKKMAKKYLTPLLKEHPDTKLLDVIRTVLKPDFNDFIDFAEPIYDIILEEEEVPSETVGEITDQILLAYEEGKKELGDSLVLKYYQKYLTIDNTESASRLMTNLLEKSEKPVNEILPHTFTFIKELISRSMLEGARSFTDRIVQLVTNQQQFGLEGNLLAAKITEKFALYVADENPDLASEYAYQSADYYRRLNNFEGVVSVYTNLATKFSSPKRTIRTFKRGLQVCKKFNASRYEAKLLSELTRYLISTKHSTALASFQQTLEKLEDLENLDELFSMVLSLLESAIESDNLKVVYSYLDYTCRLSGMINENEKVAPILVFLFNEAKKQKDDERVVLVEKYLKDLKLSPKKFKKEYKDLIARRMEKVGVVQVEALAEEEIVEPEFEKDITEIVEKPELKIVSTSDIVSPAKVVSPIIETEKKEEEDVDEEFVKIIKTFEEKTPESSKSVEVTKLEVEETKTAEAVPSLESLEELTKTEHEPKIESFAQVEMEKEHEVGQEVLEIPEKGQDELEKAALSDSEISKLFSMGSSEKLDEKAEVDLKLQESALSDTEITGLFSSKKLRKEEIIQKPHREDEWEVDSFGRLWKKGTMPKEGVEVSDGETPDLSPLEKFIQDESVQVTQPPKEPSPDSKEKAKETIEPTTVLEHTISKTQEINDAKEREEIKTTQTADSLFKKEVPDSLSSIVQALAEDEQLGSKDAFAVPEVSYEEITAEKYEKEEDTSVQPPDLADLFYSALSELGTIAGEPGRHEKKRKKKK